MSWVRKCVEHHLIQATNIRINLLFNDKHLTAQLYKYNKKQIITSLCLFFYFAVTDLVLK